MRTRRISGRQPVRVGMVLAALTILLGVSACGSSDASSDSKQLRIAYVGVASWLPAMIAESEEFFADEGLDVKSEIVTNLATLPGAMGRQFDLAATTIPDVIGAQANGVEVEPVAGQAWETDERSVVRVLAAPDSDIKSVKDLKGKRVGAGTLGGNIHPATKFWLSKSGVNPEQVTFSEVPFPQQPAQLKAGSVDAVEALEPFASSMIADGAVDLGSPLLAVGDPVSISSWMAASSWAKDNKETIEKFVTALNRAKEFIASDEDAARRILQERTELPEAVAKSVKLPKFDFELTDEDFDAWSEVVKEQG